MDFRLNSPSFPNGGILAKKFTCDGADASPEMHWTEPPGGTRSLALIVDDPDAPAGTWVHWVLYELAGETRQLAEGAGKNRRLPRGAREGRNDFGKIGYNGPCPPKGDFHRYFFKLYALGKETGLPPGASKSDLEHAMQSSILARAEIIGRYRR